MMLLKQGTMRKLFISEDLVLWHRMQLHGSSKWEGIAKVWTAGMDGCGALCSDSGLSRVTAVKRRIMSLFDLLASMVDTGLVANQFHGRCVCRMKIGWVGCLMNMNLESMEEEALTGRDVMPTDFCMHRDGRGRASATHFGSSLVTKLTLTFVDQALRNDWHCVGVNV
jgi:hypothetical protein